MKAVEDCGGSGGHPATINMRGKRLIVAMITVVAGGISPLIAKETFPSMPKKLPSGSEIELLEGQKAILPQGMTLRPINRRGLALVEEAEGFVGHLYNDSAHYCTIGYGRLIKKAPCDGSELEQYRGKISKAQAERWLTEDMGQAEATVMTSVTTELNDDQYAALCVFVFNVGGGNFKKSTLLQVINSRQFDRVPAQFRRWTTAGGKTWPGLLKRRNKEIALFFYGTAVPKGVPIPGEDLSHIDILKGERPAN